MLKDEGDEGLELAEYLNQDTWNLSCEKSLTDSAEQF